MRYKIVPEPRGVDLLLSVRDAVPLVPGSVDDCCTRIRDRTELESRDAAREWLTFCQALGLVEETDRGYRRIRDGPGRDALGQALGDHVFGAEEVLRALGTEEPRNVRAVFARVRGTVPRWERDRYQDWEDEWRERIRRLLEWGVAFGRVEYVDGERYIRSRN
jgi:hypothetical protein